MNLLKISGRLLVRIFLVCLIVAFATTGIASAQCGTCGTGDKIEVSYYAYTITQNGSASATLCETVISPVPSSTTVPVDTITDKGTCHLLKKKVYSGSATATSDAFSGSSYAPYTIYFEPKNSCGLSLWVQSRTTTDGVTWTSWTSWEKKNYILDPATNLYMGVDMTIQFKVKLLENDEDKKEDKSEPDNDDTEVQTESGPAGIPLANQDVAPGGGGQPSTVNPATFQSEADLGLGESGTSAGSIRLAGPIASTLPNVSNLEVLNPETDSSMEILLDSGNERQILTSENLIDILPISGGGVRLRYFAPGQFGTTKDPSFYPITGTPFKTVSYTPLAAVSGQHLGGVRTVVEGVRGTSYTRDVVKTSSNGQSYRVIDENGLRVVDVDSTFLWSGGYWHRSDLRTEKRSDVLYSKEANTYRYLVRRAGSPSVVVESYEFLTQNLTYTDASNSLATTYTPDPSYLGRVKSVVYPDGSWEAYTYYSGTEGGGVEVPMRGLLKETMRPWENDPASPSGATSTNCERTLIEYGYDSLGESYYPVRRTTTAPPRSTGSEIIRKWEKGTTTTTLGDLTTWMLLDAGIELEWLPGSTQVEIRAGKTFASSSESIEDSTFTYDYPSDGPDYPWNGLALANLDSTASGTVIGYQMGSFDEGTGDFAIDLSTDPQDRTHIQSIAVTMRAKTLVANESTKVMTVTDLKHHVLRRETWICTGYVDGYAQWSHASTTTYDYPTLWADGSIREAVAEQDGRIVSRLYQTSGLQESQSNEQGIETVTVSDLIGRTVSETQTGSGTTQSDRVTSFVYSGRTTSTTRSGGSLALTRSTTQDLAGRTLSETDESGATTTYNHDDELETIATLPGGLTQITDRNIDGRILSETGTSVVAKYYAREVYSYGAILRTELYAASNSPRYVKTITDWAGRTISVIRPNPAGSGGSEITETRSYHPGTYEVSSISSNATTTASSGIALAAFLSEVPDNNWTSSLRRSGYSATSASSLVVDSHDPITETLEYYEFDSTRWWLVAESRVYDSFDGSSTSTAMVTKSKRCLKGDLVKTIQILPSGEEISVTTTFNRTTKTRTDTKDTNRSTLDAVITNVNGLTSAATSHVSAVADQYIYDDLGRSVRAISSTGAVTRTGYRADGKVEGTTDHYGASTRYDYYGPTHASAGRVSKVTHPDGTTTTYTYTSTGKVEEVAGSASYKTTYTYDSYGALETLGTWRTGAGADLTTWTYHAGTGLLTAKTDAAEESVTYSYHPSGKLNRRTWARGVYTDYLWDRLGNLTSKNYSDSTPDVTFGSYDRAGRPTGVDTYHIGNETFSYHDGKGLLNARYYDTSTTNSPYLTGLGVQYLLDSTGRVETAKETSGGSSLTQVRAIGYGYDSSGRLSTVTDSSQVHTYGYKSNSTLIDTIKSSTGGTDWFRETQYRDATGRLLGNLAERMSGSSVVSTIARNGYQHDASGRRTSLRLLDGSKWEYAYNDRSEVTSAARKDPAGDAISRLGATYNYDGIGNRTSAYSNVLGERTYTTNELNQYDEIAMDDQRTAIGRAPTSMTIQVNGTNATRSGELYYRTLTASNSSAPVWQQVVTRDSDNDPSVTSYFWYDPATLNPEYDEDGNLENDGRWVYTWDAENRLAQMETTTAATTAGHPYTKLVFKYDWEGRRLARTVYRGGSTTHESTRRWLNDGWNPILECSATSESATSVTRLNILTWGSDLSGDLRGSGGVGGLLTQVAVSGGSVYRTSYDGNGNIVAWTRSDQATPQWKSEYDAFGNPMVTEGTSPSEYGFSTKSRDPYTGLSYYGYRYYDPVTGRWPSRDPIEEKGGVNLFGMVGNDVVNAVDPLGLEVARKLNVGDFDLVYSVMTNEGDMGDYLFRKIGRWGQPSSHAFGFYRNEGTGVMSQVEIVGGLAGGANCNTMVNPRSMDAGAIFVDATNTRGKGCCKYKFYFSVALASSARGEASGASMGVKTLGGEVKKSWRGVSVNIKSQDYTEKTFVSSEICICPGEKMEIASSFSSITVDEKMGVSIGEMHIDVTKIEKTGSCKK